MNESTEKMKDAGDPAEGSSIGDTSVAKEEPEANQEDLAQGLEDARQKTAEYHEKTLRMQAEIENLRKRAQRDVSNAHKYAVERFASELLQVKDSLELGLGAGDAKAVKLQEGMELTLKMLTAVMKKFSIEEVDPGGEVFDPNLHQAMTMQESADHEPNTVIRVMQKGYTLHDRLLRPAMVIVAKTPQETTE